MVMVVIENFHGLRHTFLATRGNPKFAVCFRRTCILSAFFLWDVPILGAAVVMATFRTNPRSFDSSRTVNIGRITVHESMVL
jgi:hypothetical protein